MTTIAAAWKRMRTAVLALVALASSAGVALAQEFEKVENLPRQEIPAGRFVAIAYGIIWLAVVGLLLYACRERRSVWSEEEAGRLIALGGVAFPVIVLFALLAYAVWLMPAIRPSAASSQVAARPISAPPTRADTGVNSVGMSGRVDQIVSSGILR